MKSGNVSTAVFSVLALVAFTYLGIRSVTVPMVNDEAASFINFIYIGKLIPFGPNYLWQPNNHVLNSVSAWLTYQLLGPEKWVLRLPNLISFLFFSYWLYRYGVAFIRNGMIRWGFWLLVFGSHYLLEFFAYSRGYGLGNAFLMGSVYYLCMIWRNHKVSNTLLLKGVLCTSLALFANLNLLVYALLYLIAILAKMVLARRNDSAVSNVPAIVLISVIAFHTAVALKLRSESQFYIGTHRLVDMWGSWGYALGNPSPTYWTILGGSVWAIGLVFFLLVSFKFFKSRKVNLQPFYIPLFIYMLSVSGLWLLHNVIGVLYPAYRTSLHIYLLFILSVAVVGDLSSRSKLRIVGYALFAALAVPLFAYSFQSLNIKYCTEEAWKREQIPEDFYEHLSAEADLAKTRYTIGSNWGEYRFALIYYDLADRKGNISLPNEYGSSPSFTEDFQVVTEPYPEGINNLYTLVKRDEISTAALFQRNAPAKKTLHIQTDTTLAQTNREFSLLSEGRFASEMTGSAAVQFEYDLELESSSIPFAANITLEIRDSSGQMVNYSQVPLQYVDEGQRPLQVWFPIIKKSVDENWKSYKTYLWNSHKAEVSLPRVRVSSYTLEK